MGFLHEIFPFPFLFINALSFPLFFVLIRWFRSSLPGRFGNDRTHTWQKIFKPENKNITDRIRNDKRQDQMTKPCFKNDTVFAPRFSALRWFHSRRRVEGNQSLRHTRQEMHDALP